ncbi:putative Autophagy-related protein 27 [Seiridium unicorne]|uniref:Autophagy-related protein 27 n=1 Tax=Seiridium unicorne TaxID=138068 RepID=A0ABR2V7R8_9PEZI
MRLLSPPAFFALLSLAGRSLAAEADKTTTAEACTATNAKTGSFFDLRPDIAVKTPSDGSNAKAGVPTKDYKANGYDYGYNFTLNICGPVVEEIDNVRGNINQEQWKNISAYYQTKGDVYSLGFSNGELKPRGRKLVLQYSGGSTCGQSSKRDADSAMHKKNVHSSASYKYSDYEDEEERSAGSSTAVKVTKETDTPRQRKSATISFLCDRDPTASSAAVSFVGTDPDECAYFFEARSIHACAGAEPHAPGSVGPGAVFGIILMVAILVYIGGGIFYQRTVANQRGWRQLPNYSLWAGIWSFVSDMFIAATSSCAKFLPNRRGYHYLSGSPSRTRQTRDREAENRLIDQYDEEWDD